MQFDILTIFPEIFPGVLNVGIVGKAIDAGLIKINVHDLRSYTLDRHRSVDDLPYGGGPGMIMKPEPVFRCLKNLGNPQPFTVLLSPQGQLWNQDLAKLWKLHFSRIAILCGRYEGIDERIQNFGCHFDLSIGNYVLAGGEIAAMCLIETLARLVPGVVGDQSSVDTDSLSDDLLKYPQYTRPGVYEKMVVPDILLSGNHAAIQDWRKEKSLQRTYLKRPDLFSCNTYAKSDTKAVGFETLEEEVS